MTYRTLKAEFHAKGAAAAEQLHARRVESESTLTWNFLVGNDAAFCVLTTELALLQERVFLLDREIASVWGQLPSGASYGYINTLLIREIEATNEIEQVRSTRQEISEAIRAKLDVYGSRTRFQEIARLYSALARGEHSIPQEAGDVRAIFDAITDGELDPQDQIEGPLFRSGTTNVMGATDVIHVGVPAFEIEDRIDVVIRLLNSAELPGIVATMVTHFMFEYIHPFYDGNGRTGRFLMAQKLQSLVSIATAMALSPAINEAKNRYYKAFESAEHPLNRGDLTPFVSEMLRILVGAQREMLHDLQERKSLFDELSQRITARPATTQKGERHKKILFILGQVWLFDEMRTIQLDDLQGYFAESKATIRRDVQTLEDEGLVGATTQRPLSFTLTEKARNELGLTD